MEYHGNHQKITSIKRWVCVEHSGPGNSSCLVVNHRIFGGSSFDPLSDLSGSGACWLPNCRVERGWLAGVDTVDSLEKRPKTDKLSPGNLSFAHAGGSGHGPLRRRSRKSPSMSEVPIGPDTFVGKNIWSIHRRTGNKIWNRVPVLKALIRKIQPLLGFNLFGLTCSWKSFLGARAICMINHDGAGEGVLMGTVY
jgi:hypothetical protein